MLLKIFKRFGLILILTVGSSCAVSMKMHGNRFESSEVYGKTAFRLKTDYRGHANVELTDDYTLTAPNTNTPEVGPTHDLVIGGGVGIKDRFEISFDTAASVTGKFQILGEPKLRAGEGNFSLSILATLLANSYDNSGSSLFSSDHYELKMDYVTASAAILAGYRLDRSINFYFGPFAESGEYEGTYRRTTGTPLTVDFKGTGRNTGAIVGMEIGSPRVTGMLEAVWNHTASAASRKSYWLAGAQIIISFGSTTDATADSLKN